MRIIECVPNFSEGRNKDTIDKIANAVSSVKGVKLLHVDIGYDANRTVITFAGNPDAVVEAAFSAIKTAAELIDMRKHSGEHLRIGSTDVCPLIPVKNITIEETSEYAVRLAERVARELSIPVYCYEFSAFEPHKKNLADCRKGEYENLKNKLKEPEWKPDFGSHIFNEKSGLTVIGARKFLIAYNVNLKTKSVETAKKIAGLIRESGYINCDEAGTKKRIPGLFKHLKAVGWYMEEYGCAQVSMNFTDFEKTSLYSVFEKIKTLAEEFKTEVTASELIGLIPEKAILDAGIYYADKSDLDLSDSKISYINAACKSLMLEGLHPFEPKERILEYLLHFDFGDICL